MLIKIADYFFPFVSKQNRIPLNIFLSEINDGFIMYVRSRYIFYIHTATIYNKKNVFLTFKGNIRNSV